MDLFAVATQLGAALATVTPALRVYPYGTKEIEPPAAVFALPESINPHEAYARGAASFNRAAYLVAVRDQTRRQSFKDLCGYIAETGAGSVTSALENYASYTACHSVVVTSIEPDYVTFAGASYMTAIFRLDIFGTGA